MEDVPWRGPEPGHPHKHNIMPGEPQNSGLPYRAKQVGPFEARTARGQMQR